MAEACTTDQEAFRLGLAGDAEGPLYGRRKPDVVAAWLVGRFIRQFLAGVDPREDEGLVDHELVMLERAAAAPTLPDDINPGIRRTVALLIEAGFQTCDSGDGETHLHECDRDHGYVAAAVRPAVAVAEADRLVKVLEGLGLRVEPLGWEKPPPGVVHVQATYLPASGYAFLEVEHIHDRMLLGSVRIFRVDDGAYHWVIAADPKDAVEVWRHHLNDQMGIPDSDLDLDDPPEVVELTRKQAEDTDFWEEDPSEPTGTMWTEFQRDPSRRYVGCSEW